jgi:hypothetical protein
MFATLIFFFVEFFFHVAKSVFKKKYFVTNSLLFGKELPQNKFYKKKITNKQQKSPQLPTT